MTGREEFRREGKLHARRVEASFREGVTALHCFTSADKGCGKFGFPENFEAVVTVVYISS